MTVDAYTLAEQLKHAIEDAMANTSDINEAIDILNRHIDHPELDKIIFFLERLYHNNRRAWGMCRDLSNAVRGQKVQARRR